MKDFTRNFFAMVQRDATTGTSDTIVVIASTDSEDRYGDMVDQATWVLENYKANPVVLFGHNTYGPVVGKAEVSVEGGKLMAKLTFDTSQENEMGRLMANQYANGFMNAVSVGFRSKKQVRRDQLPMTDHRRSDRGYILLENELLEISCVPIPANQDALAQRGMGRNLGRNRWQPQRNGEKLMPQLRSEGMEEDEVQEPNMAYALCLLGMSSMQIQEAAAYLEKGADQALRKLAAQVIMQTTARMQAVQDWIAANAPAAEDAPTEAPEAPQEGEMPPTEESVKGWFGQAFK